MHNEIRKAKAETKRLREEVDMLCEGLEYILRDDGLIPRATSECRRVIRKILERVS